MNCQHQDCGDANDNQALLLRCVSRWTGGDAAAAHEDLAHIRDHIMQCLTAVDPANERILVTVEKLLARPDALRRPTRNAPSRRKRARKPTTVCSRLRALTEVIRESETILLRIVVLSMFLWELVRPR